MTQSTLLTSTASPVTLRVPDFQRVYLTLVGCGGTGSHIASGLVSIAQALELRSVKCEMVFIDPDCVEEKNVGRQLYSYTDIGLPKAEALAGRLNAAFGMRIMSAVRRVEARDLIDGELEICARRPLTTWTREDLRLVIGAVDNAAARAVIADAVKDAQKRAGGVRSAHGTLWWLDCGNENHSGQVCIGNAASSAALRGAIALGMVDRLPAPSVVYPDLVLTPRAAKRSKRAPSCADLTAAGEQSLMINRLVAAWALSMLHDFVVTRDLRYFAVAIDQQWGGMRTYMIDAPTIAQACELKVSDVQVKAGKK
jgi:PRTRC genetic system ThiF family protein